MPNPSLNENDKINISKMEMFADQMNKFKQYQKTPYSLEVDESLYHVLTNLQGALSEDDLYNLSVKCHPTIQPSQLQKKRSLSKWSFRVKSDLQSLKDPNHSSNQIFALKT